MTYEEAKKILDHIRCGEGQQFGATAIDCALHLTGDLAAHEGVRSKGMDEEIPEEDWRGRVRLRAILVGTNQARHRQNSWRGRFAFFGQADGAGTC